jgi:hypothetical protein
MAQIQQGATMTTNKHENAFTCAICGKPRGFRSNHDKCSKILQKQYEELTKDSD